MLAFCQRGEGQTNLPAHIATQCHGCFDGYGVSVQAHQAFHQRIIFLLQLQSFVTIAAQCGITGHIKIEDKVVVAARSGVMNTLEAGKTYWGAPAVPYGEAARQFAAMRKLPEAFKELRALKAKAEEIQKLIEQATAEQL